MPGLLAAVLDLVWPLSCGGCGAPGDRWCEDCSGLLEQPPWRTRPTPCPPGLPPAYATAAYEGAVRRAVVSWKDRGRHDLAGPLARALAASLTAGLWAAHPLGPGPAEPMARRGPAVWVVPMPSRGAARRARGADPVRDLAVRAAATARCEGWRLRVVAALHHRREVADQAGLDAAARAANMAGALDVRPSLRAAAASARCLLVDDVITTGATLAEASSALRRAGAEPFGVAVVAATRLLAVRSERTQAPYAGPGDEGREGD